MSDCLFCKIATEEIPSQKIYGDDFTLAFLDIHPCSPGHTVIIPKAHAENIIDLKSGEVAPLFLAVKLVTEKLQRALSPKGFTIGINHGRLAGQAIDHLHVHVIPRYEGDRGGSIHSVVNFEGSESFDIIAKKISAN